MLQSTKSLFVSDQPSTFSGSKRLDCNTHRPRVEGKFIYIGNEKFFIKGATYGAFPHNSTGHQFPESPEVDKDFVLMKEAGINAILTYTVPPLSLFDQAMEHGIRVIVNVPWQTHVCFLSETNSRKQIQREVKEAITSCQRHPALLMFCISKEIPPPIVRWHGKPKMESFLKDLYHVAKDYDPECLVTYTNFPTTEYLELPFLDVFTFNVYLHQRAQFCSYLSRLQHLAGELPAVLTEFGICSFRHTREGQGTFIDWQIEEIFDHGLAGAVIFGWTDPFFQDGCLVQEWGFGLVDAHGKTKDSYEVAKRRFRTSIPFPRDRLWPKISVVVATYNSASTLNDCLSSLLDLRYPNYEVIVVNDGSTDETSTIMEKYPFHNITTPNRGVSSARNEGMRAATGEIVAYIDSDARADCDWLGYLATTFLEETTVAGVGGPNFLPKEDNWVANCVYRSPGGPTQVMLDDQSAEHIPGCNMAFWKWALEEVGGFDPTYTKAGDDVDLCWRLLDRGHRIGFSPSAVVWHHRRPSARAYWRQQVGYGVSEALLEQKHPNKFNSWGHTFWGGQIYGPYPFFRLFGRPVIYQGLWGSAGFQSIYHHGGGGFLSFLPRSMEWHVSLSALSILGVFNPWVLVLVGLGLGYTIFYCLSCALQANLGTLMGPGVSTTWRQRLLARGMIAWLHFLEPLARDWGRIKGGLTPWRSGKVLGNAKRSSSWWQRLFPWRRKFAWAQNGGIEFEKFGILTSLTKKLNSLGYAVGWNPDFQDWDLKVRRGALGESRIQMVVEYHGNQKTLSRFSGTIKSPRGIYWAQGILATSAVVMGMMGSLLPLLICLTFLGVLWGASVFEANRLEEVLQAAMSEVAYELRNEALDAIKTD